MHQLSVPAARRPLTTVVLALALVVLGAAPAADAKRRAPVQSWKAEPGKLPAVVDGYAPRAPLFGADSVWNRALPADAPLDPGSAARVRALTELIETRRGLPAWRGGGPPNLATNAFSTPIYRVFERARRVPVRLPAGGSSPALRRIMADGVPIPEGAAPAAGSDGHLTVYQPSQDTLWELWRARREADGWHADWGGAMRRVSRSSGYYSGAAWPGLTGRDGWNWGSTATSLPVAAGTVTLEELRRGSIDHALAMAVPDPCRDLFSWPAQRTDGTSVHGDCMPQGAQLRLDPALDVAALGLHPVARMLAEAAQRYGVVVRDRTRVSAQFFLESPPRDQRSPYTAPGGLFAGSAPSEVLARFPWDRLQLLRLRPCRRAPCPR